MKKTETNPRLIGGAAFSDQRGTIRFVNDFDMQEVRRFYIIDHDSCAQVRAWQAHRLEGKYFYVLRGRFAVAWVKIDDFNSPATDLAAGFCELSTQKSAVLALPPGCANGFRALEPDSRLLVFSTATLKESQKDDFRYDSGLWFDWENLQPLHKKN